MAGYTRQDTTGQLANGNPIDADIFNDEYDAIEGAFNASSGHRHDGSAGGGAPIESIGPSQELEVTSSAVFPKVNNLIDLGKPTLEWKDGYFAGTVNTKDLTASGDATINGNLSVNGNITGDGSITLGDAASDTVVFNADVNSDIIPHAAGLNLGTSTSEWDNLYLDGTAKVDTLTVDEDATIAGTLDVTGATGIDGDFNINTTKFLVEATTGNTTIAGNLSVTGTSTLTGAITAAGGLTGNVTGDVTGNLTGNVTGDVTGNATSATRLQTARTIAGVSFDGTANITIAATDLSDTDQSLATTDNVTFNNINASGNVVVTGDLTVQGTTTTVNSTTVDVADLNITVASGATTAAAADGGGITVAGANAGITYDAATDRWDLNKDLEVTNVYANLTGDVKASDGTVVLDAGTGSNAAFTGNVTGNLTGDVTGTVSDISNHTTDDLTEGVTNQYFTTDRVRTSISAGSGIDYNNTTGVISIAASTTTTVGTLDADNIDLGGGAGAGWVMKQVGTELHFIYNGAVQAKLTSTGTFQVNDDVAAEAF